MPDSKGTDTYGQFDNNETSNFVSLNDKLSLSVFNILYRLAK